MRSTLTGINEMKILHITAEALRGGCEKNCYLFIAGSLTAKHEVLVMGRPGPMSEDWSKLGVPLNHLGILDQNLFFFLNSLRKAILTVRYDMIICWSSIRLPLQLFAIRKNANQVRIYLGNPVSSSYHSLKDQILNILFPVSKQGIVLMACSRYVAESHQQTTYFNAFRIKVSLNPVEVPDTLPTKTSDSFFNLGMVARLDPIKDHATVIKGFKIVSKEITEARLHLVGDGKLRMELEGLVKKLDLQDVVYFYGDLKDVYHHLNKWDLFVYSTTPSEGLGSVVAEAMANGLPCVLSDLPMLRELAPQEETALWFAPGFYEVMAERIIELYKDSDKRKRIGQYARNHALINFSAARFIDDYIT